MDINIAIAAAANAVNVLKDERKVLQSRERFTDKEISHFYHVLEMISMDARQIAVVTKGLRFHLNERRTIKESLIALASVLDGQVQALQVVPKKIEEREQAVARYKAEAQVSFDRIMKEMMPPKKEKVIKVTVAKTKLKIKKLDKTQ